MKQVILYYPKLTGEEDSHPLYRGLPLSVLTLAAQLNPTKYHTFVIDGRIDEPAAILRTIDASCVCVGISAITSYQITDGIRFAQKIREIDPSIPIIWGGWHPSLMPLETIHSTFADIVITGQGEYTFTRLVDRLAEHRSPDDVPNLYYKNSDGSVCATGNVFLKDFASARPVANAYPYVDMEQYIHPLWGNQRVIGFESSRGCPWSCKFCSIGSLYQKNWSALSAQQTFDGVSHLYRTYNIDAIHFYDNNFFTGEKRGQALSQLLIQENISLRWDGTAVVQQFVRFSDAYIESLKRSGFYRVIVGVESGDEDVLAKINKQHSNAQVLQLVEMCQRHGIMASLSFMVGFPWNPEKDFRETVRLIEKIKVIDPHTEILLFIFSPYLGTPLYDVALKHGMKFPDSLEGWAGHTYERINTPWISKGLLRKMNRYISFFGTKDMSENLTKFFRGDTGNDKLAP